MKEYTLFVGGYTRPFFGKEGGEGIYVFGMNPETGALTLRSTNHQAENPARGILPDGCGISRNGRSQLSG